MPDDDKTPPNNPPADPPKPPEPPESKPDPDLGFPKETPVAEMQPAEQAAYWKHQSRKHEGRSTEFQRLVGNRTADQLKADLAELESVRQEKLTPSEKALEEAKKAAREDTLREFTPRLAAMALHAALTTLPEDAREAFIDTVDLSKFITKNGEVDTGKVADLAKQLAPAGTEVGGTRYDYGAGRREAVRTSRAEAGLAEARRRFGEPGTS